MKSIVFVLSALLFGVFAHAGEIDVAKKKLIEADGQLRLLAALKLLNVIKNASFQDLEKISPRESADLGECSISVDAVGFKEIKVITLTGRLVESEKSGGDFLVRVVQLSTAKGIDVYRYNDGKGRYEYREFLGSR